jgi:ribokinase
MSRKILAVGDINVDILMGGLASLPVVDREVPCESFEIAMGSTAVIFACNYSALGGSVSVSGLAGQDDYGDFMLAGLREFAVDTRLVRRTDRVRTGVTVNLIYGTTRSQVTYPGTIAEFSKGDFPEEEIKAFDHVHFAGPYGQTKFRPEITRLLRLARSLDISTSIDPQWDPTEKWEGMSEWLPLISYLFLNADEAKSISGQPDPLSACEWLAARTRCAVVKDGASGSLVGFGGEVIRSHGISVPVVDTTGAGDAFDAAFLYAVFEKSLGIRDAARLANAAAARSCMFIGGVAARSTFEQVLAFASEKDLRIAPG